MCKVSLVDSKTLESRDAIRRIPEDTLENVLGGKKIVSGLVLNDPVDGVKKFFFVFSELSIKIPGIYKLRVDCFNINK